jgi:PAS domain S-box-containing protein
MEGKSQKRLDIENEIGVLQLENDRLRNQIELLAMRSRLTAMGGIDGESETGGCEESKRTESAPVVAEMNYRELFESTRDAMLILDPANGMVLDANQKACDTYGISYADFVGTSILRFAVKPDAYMTHLSDVVRLKHIDDVVSEHINVRGELMSMLVSGAVINFNGTQAIMGNNRNISWNLGSENAAREHHEDLMTMLDSVADPLVIKNSEHRWTMVNDAFCKLIGRTRDQMLGSTDHFIMSATNVRATWEDDEAVLDTGNPSVSEQRLLTPDGESFAVIAKKMRYIDKIGERYIVSIARDITDIQQARADLEKLNVQLEMRVYERTNELMNTIDRLEAEIDERKRAERIRSATYKISELTHADCCMHEFYQTIHSIVNDLMPAEYFVIALRNPENDSIDFPYYVGENNIASAHRTAGHELIDYVLRCSKPLLSSPGLLDDLHASGDVAESVKHQTNWLGVPLKTRNGTIGVLAIQNHESEIRYGDIEKNILTFVSEQIAMTIERRKTEEELVAAKSAAERSSHLKTSLLMNLSHEFRTPMNSILGFADILRCELTSSIHKEMAQTVHNSGHRLMRTLNSIVELAQLESGNIQLDAVDVNFTERIEELADRFHPMALEKDLQMYVSVNTEIHKTMDPKVFDQVVGNLIDNAIRFTNTGSVTILLDHEYDHAGKWAIIKVQDTGIGIAPENLEVIFHEFRQLSEGFSRTHEGNGLGLTLSKKWVELLGGSITIKSHVGRGSEFTVRLPIEYYVKNHEVGNFEDAVVPIAERARTRTAQTGLITDVLVVEDNDYNMELMKLYLSSAFNVECAIDGEHALRMASSKQYSIILMDIHLGIGMDGLETTRRIRSIDGYDNVPIVAVTGYTTSLEVDKLLSGGCSHYLAKPFEKIDLMKLLDRIMTEAA